MLSACGDWICRCVPYGTLRLPLPREIPAKSFKTWRMWLRRQPVCVYMGTGQGAKKEQFLSRGNLLRPQSAFFQNDFENRLGFFRIIRKYFKILEKHMCFSKCIEKQFIFQTDFENHAAPPTFHIISSRKNAKNAIHFSSVHLLTLKYCTSEVNTTALQFCWKFKLPGDGWFKFRRFGPAFKNNKRLF